jgi:hypothetical protein
MPDPHDCPAGQTYPQEPQLLESVWVSTQDPPQQTPSLPVQEEPSESGTHAPLPSALHTPQPVLPHA